jgi:DNA-binding transcriptional MocR family regulator
VFHPAIPYAGGADVVICGGSADGLAKIYDVFFDYWNQAVEPLENRQGILVEEFVYPPPIAQIRARDVNVVPVRIDDQGMLAEGPGGLRDVIENWDYTKGRLPHVLYIIP